MSLTSAFTGLTQGFLQGLCNNDIASSERNRVKHQSGVLNTLTLICQENGKTLEETQRKCGIFEKSFAAHNDSLIRGRERGARVRRAVSSLLRQ